jgi:hypothetical protein
MAFSEVRDPLTYTKIALLGGTGLFRVASCRWDKGWSAELLEVGEGGNMNPIAAIEAFNESSLPQIDLRPVRDGRVTAFLPRLGREILVKDSETMEDVRVTAEDVAWLCEEARRAFAPGMALLEAALGALSDLERV